MVALAAAALYLLVGLWLNAGTGLVRTVRSDTAGPNEAAVGRVRTITLDDVRMPGAGGGSVIATWRGAWEVPASGMYDLALAGHGRSRWTIDGHVAVAHAAGSAGPDVTTRTVWLTGGFHAVEITCEVDAGAPRVVVAAARTGRQPEALAPRMLRLSMPGRLWLREAARVAHALLGWAALAAIAWAVRRTIGDRASAGAPGAAPAVSDGAPPSPSLGPGRRGSTVARAGRAVAWTALAAIVVHGALLRLDAITALYGTVTSPRWLAAVQTRTLAPPEAIRSPGIAWQPEPLYPHADAPATRYRSDPYIYLAAARTMPSFYAAHFREPLFPFATRMFLHLLDDQDVAVSFASAFFSVLAIWLTYILGAAVWSRSVGLLAALGLSLDYDVIAHATLGWRDDAYVAAVVLCAYLMIRCLRALDAPGPPRIRRLGRFRFDPAHLEAAGGGVAAGLAILTRIMAVSFLSAGALCLLFASRAPWRRRLKVVAIAAVTAGIVSGPYFVNCWRVYGDPLYTFNVHAGIYSQAEGKEKWTESTAGYVAGKIASRPIEMLDTVAEGLTTYPFTNKWHGLNRWHGDLGGWASMLAIVGLAVLAAFAPGRLLLIVTAASLVPSAFTWKVDPDFRFTEHAYPVLLIASAVALGAGVRAVRAILLPRRRGKDGAWWPSWRWWLPWVSVVGIGCAALWFVERVSPPWAFAEALRAREDATVTAGARDGAFFGKGWSEVIHGGNVSMRVVTAEASLSIRLPDARDYPVTLRMDPFPRPLGTPARLPALEIVVNGALAGVVPLGWTPGRVGACDLVLPRGLVRKGVNEITVRVRRPATPTPASIQPGLSEGDAVGLWYVRVHPGLN